MLRNVWRGISSRDKRAWLTFLFRKDQSTRRGPEERIIAGDKGLSKEHMYQDLFNRVAEEERQFGSSLQPPCTEEQLRTLQRRAKDELQAIPPEGYLEFLALTNGLDWNGVVVYASETVPIVKHPDRSIAGLVEMNLNYRDDARFSDLLVLGSSGMDIYTYRLSTDAYEIYDEVPHELIETVPTFNELMTRILTRSLQ